MRPDGSIVGAKMDDIIAKLAAKGLDVADPQILRACRLAYLDGFEAGVKIGSTIGAQETMRYLTRKAPTEPYAELRRRAEEGDHEALKKLTPGDRPEVVEAAKRTVAAQAAVLAAERASSAGTLDREEAIRREHDFIAASSAFRHYRAALEALIAAKGS